jgi:ArsR family metal-binding transcriptional regulator
VLIDGYEIDLYCPACDPGAEVWAATVTTVVELSELMPYVNAVVEKGDYTPSVPALIWREGAHKVFLKARQLGMSNLSDRAHAESKVAGLVQFLNETWDERESITPDFSTRSKPKVLEVFKLLPRTNCGECGVPSCMAYAAALAEGDKSLDDCPPLLLDAAAHNREMLAELGL